jgi:hypothetical protein
VGRRDQLEGRRRSDSDTQAKADIWQYIKNRMGLLTAVKGLWRSLSLGEAREVILQRLQKVMSDENIKLPEPS